MWRTIPSSVAFKEIMHPESQISSALLIWGRGSGFKNDRKCRFVCNSLHFFTHSVNFLGLLWMAKINKIKLDLEIEPTSQFPFLLVPPIHLFHHSHLNTLSRNMNNYTVTNFIILYLINIRLNILNVKTLDKLIALRIIYKKYNQKT